MHNELPLAFKSYRTEKLEHNTETNADECVGDDWSNTAQNQNKWPASEVEGELTQIPAENKCNSRL